MTSPGTLRWMAGALATTALLTGCGSSSAPALDAIGSTAFVYDIVHRKFAGPGFAGSEQKQLLSLGRALCSSLDKGRSVAQLNAGMVATKSVNATAEQDGRFVATAVLALCPKYASQLTGAVSPAPQTSAP